MSDENAAETRAMRVALDEFAKKLIEKLAPNTTERDNVLRKLSDSTHIHHSLLVLASSILSKEPQGMMVQVLIKFGPVGDPHQLAEAARKASGV